MKKSVLFIGLIIALCVLGSLIVIFTMSSESTLDSEENNEIAAQSHEAFCQSVALTPLECTITENAITIRVEGMFAETRGFEIQVEGSTTPYTRTALYETPALSPSGKKTVTTVLQRIPIIGVFFLSPEIREITLERADSPSESSVYVAARSDTGACTFPSTPLACKLRETPLTNTQTNQGTGSRGGGGGGGGSGGSGGGGGGDGDGGNGSPPACDDTIDNDGDGLIDTADPGCFDRYDDDESNTISNLTSSVTIRGPNDETIVFTFDQPREVGQYITGDWWVKGPVTITAMTPDATTGCATGQESCRNGFMVNPSDTRENAFDGRTEGYDGTLMPQLPYVAQPGESIIKSISRTPEGLCAEAGAPARQCLEFAAVLTVVANAPALNQFRPPFFGSAKPATPFYLTDQVITRIDKNIDLSGSTIPSLEDIERRYRYVQLDFIQNFPGRHVVPYQNFYWEPQDESHNYWAEIAGDAETAAVRLLGNDVDVTNQVHKNALITYLQYGIDLYGVFEQRPDPWINHGNGRRVPLAFAAYAFNDAGMTATVNNGKFEEDEQLRFSQNADGGNGFVLWGRAECSEKDYWKRFWGSGGNRQCGDPYGMIDGGSHEVGTGSGYQVCCYSRNYKYEALVISLLNAEEVWNFDEMLIYAERWVRRGTHTAPDSCAPYVQGVDANSDGTPDNYGIDYGPAQGNTADCHLTASCQCIQDTNPTDGLGRFPTRHGNNVNSGGYSRPYLDTVWETHYQYRYF